LEIQRLRKMVHQRVRGAQPTPAEEAALVPLVMLMSHPQNQRTTQLMDTSNALLVELVAVALW
jgi:hypothetical protein